MSEGEISVLVFVGTALVFGIYIWLAMAVSYLRKIHDRLETIQLYLRSKQ